MDTHSVIDSHRERICLCPYNSGCTKPFPHPRDETIFARLTDYPYDYWRTKRPAGERAVEFAIDYSLPDIETHVRRVVVKKGGDVILIIELFLIPRDPLMQPFAEYTITYNYHPDKFLRTTHKPT